jgi:hypothetical protein
MALSSCLRGIAGPAGGLGSTESHCATTCHSLSRVKWLGPRACIIPAISSSLPKTHSLPFSPHAHPFSPSPSNPFLLGGIFCGFGLLQVPQGTLHHLPCLCLIVILLFGGIGLDLENPRNSFSPELCGSLIVLANGGLYDGYEA